MLYRQNVCVFLYYYRCRYVSKTNRLCRVGSFILDHYNINIIIIYYNNNNSVKYIYCIIVSVVSITSDL